MQADGEEANKTAIEIRIAAEGSELEEYIMKFGDLTPFTCPDCHGVLLALTDGSRRRFRCHFKRG